MSYHAEILADSVGPHGHRLTTFEVTFPRMVLADMTRHRTLSYSFESTRAVPTEKRIEQIRTNPYVPPFRRRAKGMGGGEELNPGELEYHRSLWVGAANWTADRAEAMLGAGKEHVGRMLEPYSWITGIVSGTEWENYFSLRCPPPDEAPDPKWPAQYELQVIAHMQEQLYRQSNPRELEFGEWHLPLIKPEERASQDEHYLAEASAGRCAATSFLRQHADADLRASVERWQERLAPSAHWSPGEHPAMCAPDSWENYGNFQGFKQLRKFYPSEDVRPRGLI